MKRLIQRFLRLFGCEIRRVPIRAADVSGHERGSVEGSLHQARRAGLLPATVIDVGAALGSFTRTCSAIFPEAQYLLIEPLEEYIPALDNVVKDVRHATHELAVAAAHDSLVTLNVHHDLVGSSLYGETEEGTDINGVGRTVRSVTLDRLVEERQLEPPYFIKIDVQGAELDVLTGAAAVLRDTDMVLLEVSLFQFFDGGPVFCDVVEFMKSNGFVPYDILAQQYRPLDGALSQVDIAFVKETGRFRQHHYYATPEQRREQNRLFRSHFTRLLSAG